MNYIFDIDGTLWNTTDIVADAWQKAADECGAKCEKITGARLKNEFGKTMDVIAQDLFPLVTDPAARTSLTDLCTEYEEAALGELTKEQAAQIIYDGVVDTMRTLEKDPDNRLFIVSNCQDGYIELFMDKSGTEDLITDHLCYGQTRTDKGTSIRLLMERNGLSPADTVYIGDTSGDHEASRKAGIRFVFCEYGFGTTTEPDFTVSSFAGITSLTYL